MNKLLFIANWKSNKTASEAVDWLKAFDKLRENVNLENKEVILCPSYLGLPFCFSYIKENNLPIKLGVQDVSAFRQGAYSGEVSARQVKEFAMYTIIGHSERRKYNHETDDELKNKILVAKQGGLNTIYCVQDKNTFIPEDADFVAYEPVFAIGTGTPDTPKSIENTFSEISKKTGKTNLIYGGSIDFTNIKHYTRIPLLSGFLIGSASLDPNTFINILQAC